MPEELIVALAGLMPGLALGISITTPTEDKGRKHAAAFEEEGLLLALLKRGLFPIILWAIFMFLSIALLEKATGISCIRGDNGLYYAGGLLGGTIVGKYLRYRRWLAQKSL